MKRFLLGLFCIGMLVLSGCKSKNVDVASLADSAKEISSVDNSKDVYYRTFLARFTVSEDSDDYYHGMEEIFRGGDSAFLHSRHMSDSYEKYYTELIVEKRNGEGISEKWNNKDKRFMIGQVALVDQYAAMTIDQVDDLYVFGVQIYDEDSNLINTIPLDFMTDSTAQFSPNAFAVDKNGYIHIGDALPEEKASSYYVVSPEGKLVYKERFCDREFERFVCLYDGRIALECIENVMSENKKMYRHSLEAFSYETSDLNVICFFYDDILYANLYDANSLIYATEDGLYTSNLDFENESVLYAWNNHGLSFTRINGVEVNDNKEIYLLYQDMSEYYYLVLGKTETQESTVEIEFIVGPGKKSIYSSSVSEFNKLYPQYKLILKENEDETYLLSRLATKECPGLIDASFVDFESLEKCWLPLDDVYSVLNIEGALNRYADELGKIGGVRYGVVTDYFIETLISESGVYSWNYNSFIDEIGKGDYSHLVDFPSKESVFVNLFGTNLDDAFYVLNTDDGYYVDEEKLKIALDIVNAASDIEEDENLQKELGNRQLLAKSALISKPATLLYFDKIYGRIADYAGYPGKETSYNIMIPDTCISICKKSKEEVIEGAIKYIEYLMSYETQCSMIDDDNYSFSVRNDVLEEQIRRVGKGARVPIGDGLGDYIIEDEVDTQILVDRINSLLNKSKANSFDRQFEDIIFSEITLYFEGNAPYDKCINQIKSRIGIYIMEKK